jgi:hypothetical protein
MLIRLARSPGARLYAATRHSSAGEGALTLAPRLNEPGLPASRATAAPDPIDQIIERVSAVCPRPSDPFEITAVLESLGYTDAVIEELTTHSDSRSLGHALYESGRVRGVEPSPRPARPYARRDDLRVLVQTFSLSSIYALPWVLTFLLQRWHPEMLQVPQQAAAPLALALMFSLIVSGGFVQCTARKGTFYTGLGQQALGAEVSLRIWQIGMIALVASASVALGAAWYFEIFEPAFATLGAVSYILLGTLWLTCGALWLERRYWEVPAAFAGGAAAFILARQAAATPLLAQFAAGIVALTIALGLMALALRRHRVKAGRRLTLPRFAVLVRALAPYFCYGVGYFAFVFADRLAAGSAVPTASGIHFSVDGRYQSAMDAALLCFLMSMAAVEFLNHRFVHFWQRDAARWTPSAGETYRTRVRRACVRSQLTVAAAFGVTVCAVALLPSVRQMLSDPVTARVWIVGLVGYLLLELALFNSLALFSVNAPVAVLRALLCGLVVNAAGGYLLSNAFGPMFAAGAMAAGAAIFLWRSGRALAVSLGRPGYGCYVS